MSSSHLSARAHDLAADLHGSPADVSPLVDQSIVGTSGNDSLGGGAGDDTIRARGGNDTVYGRDGNDVLKGGQGNDYLDGLVGDDRVYGGAGNDHFEDYQPANETLFGGTGDDSIYLTGAQQGRIIAEGGGGADSIILYATFNKTDWKVGGGDGDDVITVSSGHHAVVDAGAGADSVDVDSLMRARVTLGAGADTFDLTTQFYTVGQQYSITDFVAQGAGHDEIKLDTGGDPFSGGNVRAGQLGDDAVIQKTYNIDRAPFTTLVTLDGVDVKTLGSSNIFNNQGQGLDPGPLWRLGSDGADTLHASTAFERLDGGVGNDQLLGDDNANVLYDQTGDDILTGNGGADTIWAGAGTDQLTGGVGADLFIFSTIGDSLPAAPDLITDLTAADTVDLSRIDASASQDGDQAFTVVSGFSGAEGQLVVSYDAVHKLTVVSGDVNGDSQADFALTAKGDHTADIHFVL